MARMPVWAGEVTRAERRRIMRLQVILATAVLGLIVATVTAARQQATDSPKGEQQQRDEQAQAGPKTVKLLRTQVAHYRTEVEMREIEHESLRAVLVVMGKDLSLANWEQAKEQQAKEQQAKLQ